MAIKTHTAYTHLEYLTTATNTKRLNKTNILMPYKNAAYTTKPKVFIHKRSVSWLTYCIGSKFRCRDIYSGVIESVAHGVLSKLRVQEEECRSWSAFRNESETGAGTARGPVTAPPQSVWNPRSNWILLLTQRARRGVHGNYFLWFNSQWGLRTHSPRGVNIHPAAACLFSAVGNFRLGCN